MSRFAIIVLLTVFSVFNLAGQAHNIVVVDSATKMPLPNASIFDRQGNVIGVCDSKGKIPYIPAASCPVTVRYIGYKECVISSAVTDTVFLQENPMELPEVVVESPQHKLMHILAYVREYSTLSTYTDTVFLFREKMVDYMLRPDERVRFKGWSNPRIIKCKSYYRFADANGLDSVSNVSNYHFSWSDWIGVAPIAKIPSSLRNIDCGVDTLRGKYGKAEIWIKNNDKVTVNIDVLADRTSRKWVPNLSGFFENNLDFDRFNVRFNYDNIIGDSISPMDLTGYSFNVESNGRGHEMFRFNTTNEPFFVNTYAEVYVIDKELITVKEAKRWERHIFNTEKIEIIEPMEAPDLQPSIKDLIARVNLVDTGEVRLAVVPDSRLMGRKIVRENIAQRALQVLKNVTGISRYKLNRNTNRRWKNFKKEQRRRLDSRKREEVE